MSSSTRPSAPTMSRLDLLSNELLENVMENCDGAPSLYALVKANSPVQALFEMRPAAYLPDAIRCSAKELQLQKILCTILSIRQHRRKPHATAKSLQAHIDAYLNGLTDLSFDVIFDVTDSSPPSDALNLLRDAAHLCDDVAQAERSLVETQLGKISKRIKSRIATDRSYGTHWHPFQRGLDDRHLSPTELHRIRRALWRLRLYFEAFSEPCLPSMNSDQDRLDILRNTAEAPLKAFKRAKGSHHAMKELLKPQQGFFYQMTYWELEEMECAWYHLQHQSPNLWRRPCPHCHENLLPDNLVPHTWKCEGRDDIGHKGRPRGCDFKRMCRFFRLEIKWFGRRETLAAWNNPLAREPSEGYEFFFCTNAGYHIYPGYNPCKSLRGPHSEFLSWGYCMWDRDRMEAWRLVDVEAQNEGAMVEWWSSVRWWRERAKKEEFNKPIQSGCRLCCLRGGQVFRATDVFRAM